MFRDIVLNMTYDPNCTNKQNQNTLKTSKRSVSNQPSLLAGLPEAEKIWHSGSLFNEAFLKREGASLVPDSRMDVDALHAKWKTAWEKRAKGFWLANEDHARDQWINNLLEDLGFGRLWGESVPVLTQTLKPDYVLYASQDIADDVREQNQQGKFKAALCIAEAKRFSVDLSTPLAKDAVAQKVYRYPSDQIAGYLSYCSAPGGKPYFRWGILTNGHTWRLYSKDATPDEYFEIRLGFKDDNEFIDRDEFRRFLTFFSADAFSRDGEQKCRLDQWREQSIESRIELEQRLREKAPRVVERIALGFAGYSSNHIKLSDEEQRDQLFKASVTFLFRLLFVLYAESRNLLPAKKWYKQVNNQYIDHFSMEKMYSQVKAKPETFLETTSKLYSRLGDLFKLIEGTGKENDEIGVTRFDGGLFDFGSDTGRLLKDWKMGDRDLAGALRELMFDDSSRLKGGFEFEPQAIDYQSLQVRQLGDIYEGLIGGSLVLKGKSDLSFITEKGTQQLEGAFYTPDWVVRTLVETTLGPLIRRIDKYPDVRRSKSQDDSFADRVLQLRIVDPAIGSGHFLVRATEWLADQILRHRTTRTHTPELDEDVEHEKQERAFWLRRVVENCIFGVDMNELAVELARLSLWLTCISPKQPLSFLDHHIRHGNSLVFSRFECLSSPPGVKSVLPLDYRTLKIEQHLAEAVQRFHEIEAALSNDMKAVKRKKKDILAARTTLEPFVGLADYWVALLDDAGITEQDYVTRATALLGGKSKRKSKTPRKIDWKKTSQLSEKAHDSFVKMRSDAPPMHWEFCFPDVYFDQDGKRRTDAGFDAVLGNPPYVAPQTTSAQRYVSYMRDVFGFNDNLYSHFVKLAIDLLHHSGRLGMIVSDTFLTLQNKPHFRQWLRENRLEFLGLCNPFDATIETAMIVLEKTGTDGSKPVLLIDAQQRRRSPEVVEAGILESLVQTTPNKSKTVAEIIRALNDRSEVILDGPTYTVKRGIVNQLPAFAVPQNFFDRSIKQSLFLPTRQACALYSKVIVPGAELIRAWDEKIASSDSVVKNLDAIKRYQAQLKAGEVTLVGLIAEGGQGLRTANNGKLLAFLRESEQAESIRHKCIEHERKWLKDSKIATQYRQLLVKYKNKEIAIQQFIENAGFDQARDLGLGRGELYRTISTDQIALPSDFDDAFKARRNELLKLWKTDPHIAGDFKSLEQDVGGDFLAICRHLSRVYFGKKAKYQAWGFRSDRETYDDLSDAPRIATIFNGLDSHRCFVPFRKGDPGGNRWVSKEPLFIDWSCNTVDWLFENSGKSAPGSPVVRNAHLYFTHGCTWSAVANHTFLKARIQDPCVFDADSMRLTPMEGTITASCFLALLNSDIFSFLKMRFIKHTAKWEIGDLRFIPLIIPAADQEAILSDLGLLCVDIKNAELVNGDLSVEQRGKANVWRDRLFHEAPAYLHPEAQQELQPIEGPMAALKILERAISWQVEKLYGVEGQGPFNEW